MEENNVKRVHEKLLKTNLVNGYGICVFIIFIVFFQVNKTAILSFLDGTPRFAERIMLLHICTGATSHKQYIQVALLKAVHANATVCAQVM